MVKASVNCIKKLEYLYLRYGDGEKVKRSLQVESPKTIMNIMKKIERKSWNESKEIDMVGFIFKFFKGIIINVKTAIPNHISESII